ncbi:hypothetical protein IW262DRAFT_1556051 [Armillaria fumosa]|nr:hypothetical protein IW262DRAFT_1556051 [Armillaria fumosa]
MFTSSGGAPTNVAQYYVQANRQLRLSNIICIQVDLGPLTVIPLEQCSIIPGQLSRAELDQEATRTWPEFICSVDAIYLLIPSLLGFGSWLIPVSSGFELDVKTSALPMKIPAHMINASELRYGPGSKQLTVRLRDGVWNLWVRHFERPEGGSANELHFTIILIPLYFDTLLWVLELLSADAWVTPAPMNGPPNDAPTSPPLPPSSRVASPSPAPEANIKSDRYEEDELMQQVKIETEDAPVKFEDRPEGKEEDKQMDGLRDLEHGCDSEERQHAERWQPYETPLLPGMRQRDEEPIRVKQEGEDPHRELVLQIPSIIGSCRPL